MTERKSCFLFGPRQTGKTTSIRETLPHAQVFNLLDSKLFLELSQSPWRLREFIEPKASLVVIDEIQKLPALLDEVHLLIEERGIRFLMTGSSARKLRRGGVNLLGGRARQVVLHPFVSKELAEFDLERAVNSGLLPPCYLAANSDDELRAYAGTYLQEEIAAEGLSRNIPAFSRFLEVAALCNGMVINYSKIANDAQVARSTVQEYFQILYDTLIAYRLEPFRKTSKRKSVAAPKIYFFDPGIVRILARQGRIQTRSTAFGSAFETFVHHEIRAYLDYSREGEINYWRTASQFEVDFILNQATAIEVKGKETIASHDLKGLHKLKEEALLKHYLVVGLLDRPRKLDGIELLPYQQFLDRLWAGDFD